MKMCPMRVDNLFYELIACFISKASDESITRTLPTKNTLLDMNHELIITMRYSQIYVAKVEAQGHFV